MRKNRFWLFFLVVLATVVIIIVWLWPTTPTMASDNTRIYRVTRGGKVELSALDAPEGDRISLDNKVQFQVYFQRRAREDVREAGGQAGDLPSTAIVLNIEIGTPREAIDAVMDAVLGAGFRRINISPVSHD